MSNLYNEQGQRLYYCLTCLDMGWVYPRKEDGSPDYSKAKRCECRAAIPEQKSFPVDHAEKPSRRKK